MDQRHGLGWITNIQGIIKIFFLNSFYDKDSNVVYTLLSRNCRLWEAQRKQLSKEKENDVFQYFEVNLVLLVNTKPAPFQGAGTTLYFSKK